jgi:GT2 family glycosyltransferase
MDATIVIPVFNQLAHTQECLKSLNTSGCPDTMIVVVNNNSTDGTVEYLAQRPQLRVIHNAENRACAAAWNQGFYASATKWTVFLNNDVVASLGWLQNLVAFAEREGVDIASPAMGEGELNYDLDLYAHEFVWRMCKVRRRGAASGTCFMVSRKIFDSVGPFDENFRRGGNEDTDFFWRAKRAGFQLAVTGCAYIHHYGGVTQKAVIAKEGSSRKATITYFRQKWGLTWPKRRWMQMCQRTAGVWWKWGEWLRHGHTLRERRLNGKILYG